MVVVGVGTGAANRGPDNWGGRGDNVLGDLGSCSWGAAVVGIDAPPRVAEDGVVPTGGPEAAGTPG